MEGASVHVIQGFVGLLGHGKTMLAVELAGKTARQRKAVLASNIKIDVPGVDCIQLATGDDGIELDDLWTLVDVLRAEGRGLVLMLDEVGILMPARFWASFPVRLMMILSQSRKLRLDLIYTSQDVEQVDSFLRRLTQWIHKVRAYPGPSIVRQEQGVRPWFFYVSTWRPATVDKRGRRLGWRLQRYRREYESWYNTDEIVEPAERVTKGRKAKEKAPIVVHVPEPVRAAPVGPTLSEWPAAVSES